MPYLLTNHIIKSMSFIVSIAFCLPNTAQSQSFPKSKIHFMTITPRSADKIFMEVLTQEPMFAGCKEDAKQDKKTPAKMLEPFPRLETKGAKKAKKRKVAKYVRHFFECSKVTPDVYAAFGKASLESSVKAIGETTKILSNTITVEGPACGCNAYWCGGDASYHRTVPNKPCQYCSGC